MKTAIVKLSSASPLSMGKYYNTEKREKESHADYEARTWRERLHYDENGEVYIPANMLKNCISNIAKYLSVKIQGKGQATYTKHFEAGIVVPQHMMLGINKEDVAGEWKFVPSDGVRGGSKRVEKCFPVIPEWSGETEIFIFDDTITQKVFEHHLIEAGRFIGFGVYRPRNNGNYGRFNVDAISFR